tara:strand:- start:91 stop:348 length:258 start_codon:yes stop_codon:yes gene_type:complete
VAIEWYLDREKRAEKKAAENAAKSDQTKVLQRKSRKQLNEFTDREKEVLKASYSTLGPDILAERFGRTRASVGTQANSMGLRFGQ